MITERHNIDRIEKGSLGRCFVHMDIGSEDRLVLQNLQIPIDLFLNGFSFAASLLSKDSLPVVR